MSLAQVKRAKDVFPNGQKQFDGRYINCLSAHPQFPSVIIHEERKIGKWIAYNPNGTVREIRHYTSKVKSCKTLVQKLGKWEYYNGNGELYLTETYRADTLRYAEIDLYQKNKLIGKKIVSENHSDSISLVADFVQNDLIYNATFDSYLYKNIDLVNDGHDHIEQLIPFWYSPDKRTPDYYNNYRFVKGVAKHFYAEKSKENFNGYVGLMLYLGKREGNELVMGTSAQIDYSESIQAKLRMKLKPNLNYCLKMDARPSENAGYLIDVFEALFSSEPLGLKEFHSKTSLKMELPNDVSQWRTLCRGFKADGTEQYITLGRLMPQDQLKVVKQVPEHKSDLDINNAAYYLLDNIQLYPVGEVEECACDIANSTVELVDVLVYDTIVFNNINFKFNSAEIDLEYTDELNYLLQLLVERPLQQVKIEGHTDDEGSDAYNDRLSMERAGNVMNWLVGKGIDQQRITIVGKGSKYPLNTVGDEPGRAINRRVEVIFHER